MKKILFSILFLIMALSSMSQVFVTIEGTVTDTVSGNPIPNHAVSISVDSTAGWLYFNTVYTDSSGYYIDVIYIRDGAGPGIIFVSTVDCQNILHQTTLYFTPITSTFTVDFSICSSNNDCVADFYSQQLQSLAVQFIDNSAGGGTIRQWSFGDGGTSTQLNPLHAYAQPGDYTVMLVIGTPDSVCYDSILQSIRVWDSVAEPCHAAFSAYPDSNALYSYQFIDQSSGNIVNWNWNFGDGTTSDLQNPSHTYREPGNYFTCLSIQGSDSSCYDIACDTIVVGNPLPCHADFTYFHFETDPLTIHFNNASVGGNGVNLWNFGDGTSSSEENPIHTYLQNGQYLVGLFIGDSASGCFDYAYAMVLVGDSIAEPCHAAFTAYPDSNAVYAYQFIDQSSGNISTWIWSFGDGNTSDLQNPSHIYAEPGTYLVCLSIRGADSTCFGFTCDTLTVGNTVPCNAEFSYFQPAPLTVYFNNTSIGGNGINLWNFGDGTFSSETSPVHIFPSAGYFVVGLSIGDSLSGCFDFTSTVVDVRDSTGGDCHAAFRIDADSLDPAHTFHFIDQSTGNIISRLWDFGDGITSNEQNPTHTYLQNGSYNACLTIHGADSNCFDITCDTLVIGNSPACQASFSYGIDPVHGSHIVTFTDLSTGNPESWLWSFGDGSVSNEQNPVHTFTATGTYTVCLTIATNNCTSTDCQDVEIRDSSSYHQIYGQVFAGNFPVSAGLAMIFSFDSTGNSPPYVEVFPLDSNGVYYFSMVPEGNYYVLAIPFDSTGYLPTYFGNVLNWEQATIISLGTENNPYDINLLPSGNMTPGPGSASGQINMEALKATIIDKVNMILMDAQGNAIGFTRVSTTGTFNFPTMAYGTYLLHPEMPGITSDQVMITLTPENPHAEVIMTYNGNSILGMKEETSIVNAWKVYPNPVVDQLTLSISMKHEITAGVGLYNLYGQLLSGSSVVLHDGNNKISISTASLPVGLYTLRIYSLEGVNIRTKLVKTK